MPPAGFNQGDRHTLTGQEQCQRGPGRSGPDDQNMAPGLLARGLPPLR